MSVKVSGKLASAAIPTGEARTTVILDVYGDHAAQLEAMQGKELDIEIKQHRKKRSINANALCWQLCSEIGRAITPPLAKEDVYRDAIRAVGEFEDYLIREEAVEAFLLTRQILGVGWFAEVVGDAPLRGWTEVHAYKGSSAYDTKAMSILIDYLIDQAEQMELPIGYDLREIEKIKEEWGRGRGASEMETESPPGF